MSKLYWLKPRYRDFDVIVWLPLLFCNFLEFHYFLYFFFVSLWYIENQQISHLLLRFAKLWPLLQIKCITASHRRYFSFWYFFDDWYTRWWRFSFDMACEEPGLLSFAWSYAESFHGHGIRISLLLQGCSRWIFILRCRFGVCRFRCNILHMSFSFYWLR